MNSRETYDEICKEIWHFYESQNFHLHNAFAQTVEIETESRFASPWLPPPPDRCNSQVKFLFVGLSPKRLDNYRYATSLDEAKKQAGEYRYISNGERKDIRFNYDIYYKPLLEIAKTLDSKFGVWHEIKSGKKQLLVEFTDFCHLPADNHNVLRQVYEIVPDLRKHCRKILERELRLYKPNVIVANGIDSSIDLWEMHFNKSFSDADRITVIPSFLGIENCNVHLSRFITSTGENAFDRFSKARLLNEIRQYYAKL
jgi:hypothetical protein